MIIMQTKYIFLLVGISLNSDGEFKFSQKNAHPNEFKFLQGNGYLDTDNNLTEKAQNLLASLEACSEIYEDSYKFKKDATKVVDDVKKTFEGMFNSFRNNASGMFQTMADNLKVKS